LLNFETVKYFNAESHEEQRFEEALSSYKEISIFVAKTMVWVNVAQSFIITLGIGTMLTVAYYFFTEGKLTVGEFVMFNAYNL